jgi:hypothetical protein
LKWNTDERSDRIVQLLGDVGHVVLGFRLSGWRIRLPVDAGDVWSYKTKDK